MSIGESLFKTYSVVLDSEPTGEVTVTITDPADSDEADATPDDLTFTTSNWDTEQTVTVNVADDHEDEPDETATVTHSASGGDYGAVTVAAVVVTIVDDDETPVVSGSATPNFAEFEYDADAAAFDKTVATYSATDGDGDDISWSLSGDDSERLTITENSDGDGVLSFNDPPDFENPTAAGGANAYVVTVEASDGTNTGTFDVTVNVTPVNERPDFSSSRYAKMTLAEFPYDNELGLGSRSVRDAQGTDPESDTITFSIGGADRDDFETPTNSSALCTCCIREPARL